MKKIFLLTSLFCLMLFSGCITNPSPEAEENPKSQDELRALIFEGEFSSEEYFSAVRSAVLAVQSREATRMAFEQKDPSACEKVGDEVLRKNCRNSLFEQRALTDKSEDWCNKIEDGLIRESCKGKLSRIDAASSGDATKCDRITDERMKRDCVTTANFNRALLDTDISFCERIEDQSARTACETEVQKKKDAMAANEKEQVL